MVVAEVSEDESVYGLSSRKARSSSLLMCFLFFLAHATISFVFFLCPYLVPESMHCLHTSEAPVTRVNQRIKMICSIGHKIDGKSKELDIYSYNYLDHRY